MVPRKMLFAKNIQFENCRQGRRRISKENELRIRARQRDHPQANRKDSQRKDAY